MRTFVGLTPDFERSILGNITARAHFLILLTPSALERCDDPADWLRREIETALAHRRNIVPLMLDGFDFRTPKIASQLTGKLYFMEAMEKLRGRYLNVPLASVLHPASPFAQQAAAEQKQAAGAAPAVREGELTAEQWFERGFAAVDIDERLAFTTRRSGSSRTLPPPSTTGPLPGVPKRHRGRAAGFQRGDPAQTELCRRLL